MANTYLTKTLATPTNRKKWTLSMWVKRSNISSASTSYLLSANSSQAYIYFNNNDTFNIEEYSGGYQYRLATNRVFRDTSAWYHLVISFDSTNATADDRVRIYINGVQETLFSARTNPSLNFDGAINNNNAHFIGREGASYWSGLISHIHFIDGTAYDASAFGSTDSVTGEWQINTSPSVTYGNNGFFILKDGNSVTDQSGNSNNFTVAGGTLTNTEDNPSNVFATINPLIGSNLMGSTVIFGNGNTNVQDPSGSASGVNPYFISTLGMPSKGKFYCELKPNSFSTSSGHGIGIFRTSSGNTADVTSSSNQIRYIYADTSLYISKYGTNIETLAAINSGDIVGMALDLDNGTLQYYVNGVARGNQITGVSSANDGYDYFFHANLESSSSGRYGRYYWNFGNGYFATTAVSSAGTNASGNGIFEYDCPAGYTALSTKGLNL